MAAALGEPLGGIQVGVSGPPIGATKEVSSQDGGATPYSVNLVVSYEFDMLTISITLLSPTQLL